MAGSTLGTMFKVSTWGESHGKGIGVVVDGCPAGLTISEEYIQTYLNRRKPGQTKYSTPRKEDDYVEILSGVFEGRTTGTPISMVVMNQTQRSSDYSEIANYYRPGHADYTYDSKYGFRDYRGGGRSSGRETTARVAAGAIALAILDSLNIHVSAYTRSIGPITIDYTNLNLQNIMQSSLYMPDLNASAKAEDFLLEKMNESNSVGGVIECVVTGMPAGIGEPVFEKLDANLAKAVMSVGAVKGFEIGDGFKSASMLGDANNDAFHYEDGTLSKETNHAGGILGGMSDGSNIILRAAIKPTASIARTQHTVNKANKNIEINIKGRHDPIIVPRAVVVIESMVALTLVDLLLQNMASRLDKIQEFYKN
ncbi:chorismate synthase [Anaerosporobacter mobilis DSM 15930]|uniref:Chorismate synthase n=1 Tax=Anaerosporobacter mobilis DSM 15930 TaxID=1120996 RepID=A0A1M7MUM4_9FIRM|nr:chorismate synthase [Anaerosporobacter mobilis]SHM94719.1 chorismate synthase [Anaerosporobacter mobilis DSM 15930]